MNLSYTKMSYFLFNILSIKNLRDSSIIISKVALFLKFVSIFYKSSSFFVCDETKKQLLPQKEEKKKTGSGVQPPLLL